MVGGRVAREMSVIEKTREIGRQNEQVKEGKVMGKSAVLRWIPRQISSTMFANVRKSGLPHQETPTRTTLTAKWYHSTNKLAQLFQNSPRVMCSLFEKHTRSLPNYIFTSFTDAKHKRFQHVLTNSAKIRCLVFCSTGAHHKFKFEKPRPYVVHPCSAPFALRKHWTTF